MSKKHFTAPEQKYWRAIPFAITLGGMLSLSIGCGGRGPSKVNRIDEVSLASSGVEVHKVTTELSPTQDWPGWRAEWEWDRSGHFGSDPLRR